MTRFVPLIGKLPQRQQAEPMPGQPWFATPAVFACAALAVAGTS